MRTLTDQFKDIINESIEDVEYEKAENRVGVKRIVDRLGMLHKLLAAVKKRDKYIIGNNTKVPPHGYTLSLEDVVRTINESNNETRNDQRKRAKETL